MSAHRTAPQSAPEADAPAPSPSERPRQRPPALAPTRPTPPRDVVRWAAFSCVLVPVVLVVVRHLPRRRGRRGPRPRRGHRRLPRPAAAPVRARRGPRATPAREHPRDATATPPSMAGSHAQRDRDAPGAHRGGRHAGRKYAGRLTGFRAHAPVSFQPTSRHRRTPWPNTPPTPVRPAQKGRQEAARTLRGPATATRRTSLRGPRVQRFVIECFTPSCHVDNSAGCRTGHAGTTGHSRFDHDCLTAGDSCRTEGKRAGATRTEEPRPPRGA